MREKGGVNEFSFLRNGTGKSGIDFGNLNKELQAAAKKYGGIYAKADAKKVLVQDN